MNIFFGQTFQATLFRSQSFLIGDRINLEMHPIRKGFPLQSFLRICVRHCNGNPFSSEKDCNEKADRRERPTFKSS